MPNRGFKSSTLQIMSIHEGHSEERYDPTDENDVKRVRKLIKDRLKDGYLLYGAKKGGGYVILKSEKNISDKDLDRFLLAKKVHKRLLAAPVTGG